MSAVQSVTGSSSTFSRADWGPNSIGNARAFAHAHRYLEGKARLLYPEPQDVFPCDLIDADHCRPPSSYV